MVPLNLYLENVAICFKAFLVSFTNKPLYLLANFISDTIIPYAPFLIAFSIKSWPLNLSPIRATNKSPFFIVLSSILTPQTPSIFLRKYVEGSDALAADIKSFFVHKGFNLLPQNFQSFLWLLWRLYNHQKEEFLLQ